MAHAMPGHISFNPCRHARGSSFAGASSSRRRSPDTPAPTRFADFPELLPPRLPTRTYLGVRRRSCGTWVQEITNRETHQMKWVGSFHTVELTAKEYNRCQVWYHGAAAQLNFLFGTAPVHMVPPEPGVVSAAMARED
nr:ethylene-responsive transcription factor ABI4-like [Aegilops tauschii subsp. strangulata]